MTSISVTVETPKGSNNRYAVDPHSGRIRLERELFSALAYPADYGYIDDTLGEDGEHINAFILLRNPIFPGVTVDARVVCSLLVEDLGKTQLKVITVPASDARWKGIHTLEDIPSEVRTGLEFFATHSKDLAPRNHHNAVSWGDFEYTRTIVDLARLRFDTLPAEIR
jgi:inorganic pyrophosphatase